MDQFNKDGDLDKLGRNAAICVTIIIMFIISFWTIFIYEGIDFPLFQPICV